MKILRQEVFYRTDALVQAGDEFYQIDLTEAADSGAGSFEVATFHGFAGDPPPRPENSQTFQTLELANHAFDNIVRGVEDKRLRRYDPIVHGPDKPFLGA